MKQGGMKHGKTNIIIKPSVETILEKYQYISEIRLLYVAK